MSVSRDVSVKLSVQEADAVASFLAFARSVNKTGDELEKTSTKGERGGRKAATGWKEFGGEVAKVGAAFLAAQGGAAGFQKLLSMVNEELRIHQQLRKQAADQQISAGNASRRAIYALGKGADVTPEELTERVQKGAAGTDPAAAYLEAEAALSARGSMKASRALDTLEMIHRYRPDLPSEDRRHFVSAALELQKVYGSSAEEAVASTMEMIASARTTEAGKMARNLVQGITQSRAFGGDQDSFRYMAALQLGIGQRAGDPEGRVSRTGLLTFLRQLKTETSPVLGNDATVQQQLEWITSADKQATQIRQQLLGPLSEKADEKAKDPQLRSEAQTFVAISELLKPDSKVWTEINSALERISGLNSQAVENMRQMDARIRAMPSQQATEMAKMIKQTQHEMQSEVSDAIRSIVGEGARDLLQQTGVYSKFAQWQGFKLDTLGGDTQPIGAYQHLEKLIESRRQELMMSRQLGVGGIAGAGYVAGPSPGDVRTAERLAGLEQKLERQIELLEQANADRQAAKSQPQPVEVVGQPRPQPVEVINTPPPAPVEAPVR